MAFITKSQGVVKVDNAAGTQVDISAQIRSARLGLTRNSGNFPVLGNNFQYAVHGKAAWKLDITGYMTDGTGETEAWGLFSTWVTASSPTERTITLDTPTSSTGSRRFTGETVIGGMDPLSELDASSNEPQTFTANLLGSGTLTPSVIA
jgi:hypothetical protein